MSNETAVEFFYEHAGWGYNPATETAEQGRRAGAQRLADAEAKSVGAVFLWEDDWEIGSHKDFYGPDSAYSDGEPETCEQVVMYLDGEVVASLGCIDDATPEYRRVVEAQLALEAMPDPINAGTSTDDAQAAHERIGEAHVTTHKPFLRQMIYSTGADDGKPRCAFVIYSATGMVLDVQPDDLPPWVHELHSLPSFKISVARYKEWMKSAAVWPSFPS